MSHCGGWGEESIFLICLLSDQLLKIIFFTDYAITSSLWNVDFGAVNSLYSPGFTRGLHITALEFRDHLTTHPSDEETKASQLKPLAKAAEESPRAWALGS